VLPFLVTTSLKKDARILAHTHRVLLLKRALIHSSVSMIEGQFFDVSRKAFFFFFRTRQSPPMSCYYECTASEKKRPCMTRERERGSPLPISCSL
jgi:hypothetical protein